MVGNITFLMIFAVFDPSPITLDKLQFLVLMGDNVCSIRIGLLSLELHRLHPDLTHCYRIVFDLVCVYTVKMFCISSQHEDWVAWWGNGLGDQEVAGSIRDQGVAA